MVVVGWIYENAFASSVLLIVCFFITLTILGIGAWLGLHLQQSGYTLGMGLLALGGNLLALVWAKTSTIYAVIYFALLLCVCAVVYCIALVCVSFCAYAKMRKLEREKIERAACYTLPARENEFVRERLHTVLREVESDDGERLNLSFSYARRALLRLQNEKLGLSERLETEELARLFALYKNKELFTVEDVTTLNEAFSRLMKLSAKYTPTQKQDS